MPKRCEMKSIVLSGGSGTGANTIYSANGNILGTRVVTANNNDLTFNMGTGSFVLNGPFIMSSETAADGDATPSVGSTSVLRLSNTSSTTVTNFDDGVNEQQVILFLDNNTTLQHGAGVLELDNGVDFTPSNSAIVTVIRDGSAWKEVSRAIH